MAGNAAQEPGWSSSTAQLPTRPPVPVRARVGDPAPTRTRLAAPAVASLGVKVLLERVQWPLEEVGQERKLPVRPPLGSVLWSLQPPPHMGKGGEAALCPQGPFGLEGDRLLLGNMPSPTLLRKGMQNPKSLQLHLMATSRF